MSLRNSKKHAKLKITLSASFSSFITSKAAIPTAEARGFPPKVLPCSPGLMQSIYSLSQRTTLKGKSPPLIAFPKHK